MKTQIALVALLINILSMNSAWGTCDGINLNSEENSCFTYRDRHSCELHKGCSWTPEAPFLRLCNKTSLKISVAMKFVRTNYNVIGEQGWWNLEVGQCADIEAPNATSVSYFAKSYSGHQYWFGNGEPMCFDPSGNRFERNRPLSENSCGAFTEIRSYQTLPVKNDDFINLKVEGAGQDLSPADEPNPNPVGQPGLTPRALAVCSENGNYSVRKGSTLDEAKANALSACQSSGNKCELAIWLGTDRPSCMAILSGSGVFRAWGWSFEGREVATNQALKYCQEQGQSCTVDFTICNNE